MRHRHPGSISRGLAYYSSVHTRHHSVRGHFLLLFNEELYKLDVTTRVFRRHWIYLGSNLRLCVTESVTRRLEALSSRLSAPKRIMSHVDSPSPRGIVCPLSWTRRNPGVTPRTEVGDEVHTDSETLHGRIDFFEGTDPTCQ